MAMKPSVHLVSHTAYPIRTLYALWEMSRTERPFDDIMHDLDTDVSLADYARSKFVEIINSDIPISQNIYFTFDFENISVSFREQLVRHRIGVKAGDRIGFDFIPDLEESNFWSQTSRIRDLSHFATEGKYYTPTCIEDNTEARSTWDYAMHQIESVYHHLVHDLKLPMEEVRNILPMACQHRITWTTNLMALSKMLKARTCMIAQRTLWHPIIEGIITELCTIDPVFADLSRPPCVGVKKSDAGTMREYCAGCRYQPENARRWTGEDPTAPCPIWMASYKPTSCTEESSNYSITDQNKLAKGFEESWGRSSKTGLVKD